MAGRKAEYTCKAFTGETVLYLGHTSMLIGDIKLEAFDQSGFDIKDVIHERILAGESEEEVQDEVQEDGEPDINQVSA